jgi:hypothetical protein
LYRLVKETVYIQQPLGLKDKSAGLDKVYKLNQALYSLKQAPRVWYNTLSKYLQELGFKPLDANASVFHKKGVIITIYVNNLLITGKDHKEIDALKKALNHRFKISDLSLVNFYLGITVTRDQINRTLRLGQQAYLAKVLRDFGIEDYKAAVTLIDTNRSNLVPAPKDYMASQSEIKDYQRAIRSLMYAMLRSRLDIAFAVSIVSRFALNPTAKHITAVKRILRYLKGTLNY